MAAGMELQGFGHVLCDEIVRLTLLNGGCTVRKDGTVLESGQPYYIMSVDPAWERVIVLEDFTATDVELFALNNMTDMFSYEGVGTWIHDGKVFLDVVKIIPKDTLQLSDALWLARQFKQLAIYDMEYDVEIETGLVR